MKGGKSCNNCGKSRGKDHIWELVKYKGDLMIYAKCSCGYTYVCCNEMAETVKNEDGSVVPKDPSKLKLYRYCPNCGAKKKWYKEEIRKIDKYAFEERR